MVNNDDYERVLVMNERNQWKASNGKSGYWSSTDDSYVNERLIFWRTMQGQGLAGSRTHLSPIFDQLVGQGLLDTGDTGSIQKLTFEASPAANSGCIII